MKCIVEDCLKERKIYSNYCPMHKSRLYTTGSLDKAQPLSPNERFDKYVKKDPGGCWIWLGWKDRKGYGHFSYLSDDVSAHRYSWERINGKIQDGLLVCHKCDNPSCVNPDHLFLGTGLDNQRDMVKKGRSLTGEKNKASKLTWEKVAEIRKLEGKLSQRKIGALYGVNDRVILGIFKGEFWKD